MEVYHHCGVVGVVIFCPLCWPMPRALYWNLLALVAVDRRAILAFLLGAEVATLGVRIPVVGAFLPTVVIIVFIGGPFANCSFASR